jgi:hypothetical protein
LKEIDAEMNMVGPNAKKEQAVRQLASSPWWSTRKIFRGRASLRR